MKTIFLLLTVIMLTLSSCSSDDSGDAYFNYFPLTSDNSWTYEVEGQTTDFDNLYVGDEIILNNKSYQQMKTTDVPFGFYSSLLRENGLRNEGQKLLLTGTLALDLGVDIPLDFALEDFILINNDAASNEVMSAKSGTISQDLNGTPITIDYTIKSTALETLPSFTTSKNVAYTDVKKVNFIINVKVTTLQTIPGTNITIPIPILNSQDVLTATHYYAQDIGMVYANNLISYSLAINPADFGLDIPQTSSQSQNEFLDSYTVN